MASGAAYWLDAQKDRSGRVIVEPNLSVPGNPEIFVIGDTAHVQGPNGSPLPGLAPVAKQQGAYVGRVLRAQLAGNPAPPPFRYKNWGTMATIGRRAAVADLGWLKLSGTLAWLLWGLVHISLLIGFRNRVIVTLDWLGPRDVSVRRPADHWGRFSLECRATLPYRKYELFFRSFMQLKCAWPAAERLSGAEAVMLRLLKGTLKRAVNTGRRSADCPTR
jgi:hypothetical protein